MIICLVASLWFGATFRLLVKEKPGWLEVGTETDPQNSPGRNPCPEVGTEIDPRNSPDCNAFPEVGTEIDPQTAIPALRLA